MATALGTATPSAFKVGSSDCTAIYLGGNMVWQAVTAPTVWPTLYTTTFTGTNGAAPPAAWTRALAIDPDTGQASGRFPTGGTVDIQNNAMRLTTGSTAAWTGYASIFLGDWHTPQGSATYPAIVPHAEYLFDYLLGNLTEQYQVIGLRVRAPDLWPGGGGQGTFQSGYNLMLSPTASTITLIRGYDTATLATISSVPFSTSMRMRILISGSRLAIRVWSTSAAEPTTWLYDNATIVPDQSDGSIGFTVSNGPAAAAKTLSIDNFTVIAPTQGIGTTTTAPTQTYANFTPLFVENFDTTAPAGTGASSFLNVYANSVQPYNETSPTYMQRALLSAHDGVMDLAMNGTQGAAFSWGTPSNYYNRIGGRFSIRAKAIGAWGNGPAIMIWPSNDAWVEGEIDFPESVSGAGGYLGFQDPPWIHHHTMNTDHPLDQQAAQDVNLLVSWRDWHVYTAEWYPPGKGPAPTTGMVVYYVDDVEVYRTTTDIPKTNHRFMMQVGSYGSAGNFYLDWVRIDAIT